MTLDFIIYKYFPFGGQQRDFFRIAEQCVERGHTIRVYTLSWEGPKIEGMELTLVPVNAFSRHKLYERFNNWVQAELARKSAQNIIGFNKIPGLKIYYAADPCFEEKAVNQRAFYYKLSARYKHFSAFETAVFNEDSNTEVLLLSPQQKRDFIKHYPRCGRRLHLVPPGITDDRKFPENAEQIRTEFRKDFSFDDNKLVILQVGSGFRIKGVDRSLRAIAALPEFIRSRVEYILVGKDKPGKYLKLAKKLGITEQVTIFRGRDDVPRFLLGSDLLLHPAYSESAGYVLLEATIAGLPVLTTASCGYAFHIEEAESGEVCVEPYKQSDLNSRLQSMLKGLSDSKWSANGVRYGKEKDLYSLPSKAVDYIEKFCSQTAGTSQ
ncbi:MAG: glucosyltransferase I RfaG [SAR86 cluster bacterium]|uniref:Glucosyltransferase I RfaG n=1 Tax=SAR86 cluster bacterium TaxID=2030880 RepID=A0A2A4MSW3_9GAMM|nr:MAG: glucosyltransferase I RfaG [SAR86 cluster bacterium]